MAYLFRNLLLMIIGVVLVIQLIPAEKTNPDVDPTKDLITSESPSLEVAEILKSACYDCHSHETNWPWYSYTAPAKWVISHHVVEGREELNFSTWQDYSNEKKAHKLEECVEALVEGWMPDESYVSMHEEARLTDQQRHLLVDYFEGLNNF